MKSANRPASVNYNPREIARRLEHTLYMGAASREDYSNVQTLKARLQQALDNSRRRQMQQQQQQQQQQLAVGGQPDMAQQVQAQQLQQQQLQLLQRQQQMAALQNQRNSFQGVPFVSTSGQMTQPAISSQPLQMPLSMAPAQMTAPTSASTAPPTITNSSQAAAGSSILDELEREADEMANGISDEPIAMPESELQATTPSSSGANTFASVTATPSPAAINPGLAGNSFSAVPLSMPPEISAGMQSQVTASISTGFVSAPATSIGTAVPAPGGSNLYHGMNLTGSQFQQIQQLQQMQQLRRMQQLQQLQQQQQQQQQGANAASSVALNPGAPQQLQPSAPGIMPVATPVATAGASPVAAPGMIPMNEASIAQKREELKRRLIQLKHARTCTTGDCTIDYCSRTKALLAHVSRCANAQCTTIGCKSTRQLLSHFRKCRNLQCDVCSAIRPPMNENEQQLVLRRQQERLCMLRHASTCTGPQCILPYCGGMKVLWKHICECHQRQCRTDHCISSRYVLSHFKQCSKMICEVCGPVRKAIKIVDSCRGNAMQLQMAASQCPEGIRGLIKIMNTSVPPAAGANAGNNGVISQQDGNDANARSLTAGHQRHPLGAQAVGVNGTAWQQKMEHSGTIKTEHNPSASENAALSASNSSLSAASNAVLMAANLSLNHQAGISTPNNVDQATTANSAIKMEVVPTSTGIRLPDGSELKKKPLKLQTEKEKKLRRKEQAKIAKARAQAKREPTSSQPPNPVAPVSVNGGLVISGSTANVRHDHHASHQDISYLDSMSEAQLDEHIRSLRFNFCGHITVTELKNRLMPLLTKLMESEYGWAFNNPVDPVQWNIPDYFDIIKCPMDLGSIKKRLENEHYSSVEAFAGDVRLVFENCIAYNSSTNKFNIAAKQLLSSFDKALAALKTQLEKQLFKRCEQRREEMCQLCGGDSFKFAPCMLFCSGPCAGRIRRHTHYYSDPRGEHHWCSSCFKQMKDGPIDMSTLPQLSNTATSEEGANGVSAAIVPFDGVLKKSSLVKRKNSEVAEEPWVECDSCKLWYHQICALFNERNHAISGEQEPFVCPLCVKKQRAVGVKPSMDNGLKAKRLPITRMAKLIETRVLESIEKAIEDEAARMGSLGNSDSIGFSRGVEESKSETRFGITIREVLSVDKQVQIKPKMGKLLAAHYGKPKKTETRVGGPSGPPKSLKRQRDGSATKKRHEKNGSIAAADGSSLLHLTYRSRCICVFQELDGVDVLIFTLYVQEYGPDSLDPNRGRVYVSYLDSVNYFQPKKLRTLMHQQVMLGFLEDCKNRGFHTAHIWSCPPLKGDDYIFFCKPENQKIPKSARLRQWYQKLLQQAKKDGLVINISNLYAEYYLKKKAAHELPYFEGDYWPRLAEDLIKQLEEKSTGGRGEKSSATPSSDGLPTDTQAANDAPTDAKTPASPTPSDLSVQSNGEDSRASISSTPAAASKVSVNAKSKKKRSKKAPLSESSVTATRSTTKNRSKKGDHLSRPSGTSKNTINSDPLMQKLKGILEPQKDDFFVVDLHPKCHKCAVPIVHVPYWQLQTLPPPASVTELVDAVKRMRTSSGSRNSPPRHYHHYYCTACYESNKTQLQHRVEVAANGAKRARELSARISPLNEKAASAELADLDLQEIKFELSLSFVDPRYDATPMETDSNGEIPAVKATDSNDMIDKEPGSTSTKMEQGDASKTKDGGASASTATTTPTTMVAVAPSSGKQLPSKTPQKQGTETALTSPKASASPSSSSRRNSGRTMIGAELDDVIMPCEIFDTREAFLMYCQNNHCQFDQIRRAKHSSMMVLYHLFNQGTTGFTFSCSSCKITLLSGNRWNCSICPVFNLCDECKVKTKHDHTLHLFKIVPIPRAGTDVVVVPDASAAVPGADAVRAMAAGKMQREAGSSELKRAKMEKMSDAAIGNSTPSTKGTKLTATGRKRKLNQASPVKISATADANGAAAVNVAVPAGVAADPSGVAIGTAAAVAGAEASNGVAPTPPAGATNAGSASSTAGAPADANGEAEDPSKKQRRIHGIDPQLLLQLDHASSCTVPDCTFFNCQRMRSMLKHGATCEQRLAGPCVLCKRIVGLLSAHARQCQKEFNACHVPRCADIRRHFMQQLQQRQQQLERAKQQNAATATGTPGAGAAPAPDKAA